jgi:site-specific DNA-methyltransferase (adenine-specific)
MKWCLSLAPKAVTVLDPFMGSGSTLIAAKHRGIVAFGIDKEERYCEIAADRLRQGVLNFQ